MAKTMQLSKNDLVEALADFRINLEKDLDRRDTQMREDIVSKNDLTSGLNSLEKTMSEQLASAVESIVETIDELEIKMKTKNFNTLNSL